MEALQALTSPELDRSYDEAVLALNAAQEAVLNIQDERHRRFYVINTLRRTPDWPQEPETLF